MTRRRCPCITSRRALTPLALGPISESRASDYGRKRTGTRRPRLECAIETLGPPGDCSPQARPISDSVEPLRRAMGYRHNRGDYRGDATGQ